MSSDSHQIMLPPPRPQTVLLSIQVLPPQQPDFELNGAKRDVTNNIGGRGSVASKSKTKRKARATSAMASDDNNDDLEPSEQHAHTRNESSSSLTRIDKFLLPVKAEDSLGDVWRQVERQYERMYPHKARDFRIKKLQNGTGYDLHLDFRVRDMFPESLAEKVVKVHQVYSIREMSILPESTLRPQHTPLRSDITRKRGRKSPAESTSKRRRLAHQPELQDMEKECRDDEAREDNVDVPRPTLEAKPEDEVAAGVFATGNNMDIDNYIASEENKSSSRRRSSPSVIVHSDERNSSFRSRTSSGPWTQLKAGEDNIASVRGKSRRTLSSLANGAQVSGAEGFYENNVVNDDSNDAIDGHVGEKDTFGQFSRQRTSTTSQLSDRVHVKDVFDAPESPGEESGRTQRKSTKRSVGKLSKTPARVVDLSRMRSLKERSERSEPQSRPSSSAARITLRENSSPATLRRTSQSTGLLSNRLRSMGIEVPASPQFSDPDQALGKEERKRIQNKNASRRQRYIRELQTLIDTSKGRTDSHAAIKKTTPSLKSSLKQCGRKGAIAKSNAAAVSSPEALDSHDIINEAVFSSKSKKTTKSTTKPIGIRSKPTVTKGSEVRHEEEPKTQGRKQSSSHNEDNFRAQKTTKSPQGRAASAQSWMTTDALDDLGALVTKHKSSAQKPRQYEEGHTKMLVDEVSTVDLDETMESPSLEKSLRQAKAKPLSSGRSSNRETPTDNDDSTSRLGEAAAQQLLMEEQASLERQDHTSSNGALEPDEADDHDSESTSDESDANDTDAAALVTDRDEEEEYEGGQKASERDGAEHATEANNLEMDIDAKSEEENTDHAAFTVRPRSMSPDLGDPIPKMSSASPRGKGASQGQDNNSQIGTSGAEEQSSDGSEDDSEEEADEQVIEASDSKAQVESNDAGTKIDGAKGPVATGNDQHPLSVDSTRSVADANSTAVEQIHSDIQQDADGDYEMNTQEASVIIPESPMATSTRARNATAMSTTLQSSHPMVEDSQPQWNKESAVAQTNSAKPDEKAAAPSHSSDSGSGSSSDSGSDSESESLSAAGSESGSGANFESASDSDSVSYDEIAPRQITGPVDVPVSTARPKSTESLSSDSDESIDEIRPRRIPRLVGNGGNLSANQPAMMHSYNTPMAPPSSSLSRRPNSQSRPSEPAAMSDGPRTLEELAAGQRSPSPLSEGPVITKTIALDSSDDDEESEDEESDESGSDSDDPKEKTADEPKLKPDQKKEETESEYEESSSSSDDEIAAEPASQKLKKPMLATARPDVEKRAAPKGQRHSGEDTDDSEKAKGFVRKADMKPNGRAINHDSTDNKTPTLQPSIKPSAKPMNERSTSSTSQRSLKTYSVTSTPILPSPRASGSTPSFQHTPAKKFRASQPTPARKVQRTPSSITNRLSATQSVSQKKQRGTPASKTQARASNSSIGRGSSLGASSSLKKTYSTTPVSPPGGSRR